MAAAALLLAALLPPAAALQPSLPPARRPRLPTTSLHARLPPPEPDECALSGGSGLVSRCAADPLSPPSPSPLAWARTTLPPLAALVLTDRALRALSLAVPHQLVGMLGGFGLLCLGHAAAPAATAALHAFYAPACRLLSTWLAAIFAPAFVTLPLAMPALAAAQLALFVGLCAAGLASSTATNALLCALFRRVGGGGGAPAEPPPAAAAQARSNPFPRAQRVGLAAAALASAAAHFLCAFPLALDVALLSSSLLAFSVASTFPPRFNLVVHPFLTTSAVTMGLCAWLALATSQSWHAVLSRYRSGAGAWLLSLMGPTVISFAFQLFAYRKQLAASAVQIVGVGVGGAMCGMLTAAAAARALGLPHVLRVALLSRSTTTALAGDVARLSSIEPGLGMLAAFATGLFGIWFGVRLPLAM